MKNILFKWKNTKGENSKETNMRVQELMLLVLVLFSFCSPASFAPVSKNLVSDNMHENMGDNGIDENNSIISGGSGMVNQSKYATALRGGASGGRSAAVAGNGNGNGNGRNGNGGQSNSSPQGRGYGFVPVYAAGAAAGQRRNHKGAAATCTPCWKGGFAVLIATASASILLQIPM